MVLSKLGQENPQGRTQLEVLVEHWLRRAKQGDTEKGKLLFAYGFCRPIQQNLNVNAEAKPEMTAEEATAAIEEMLGRRNAAEMDHTSGGVDALKGRIEELIQAVARQTGP